ncbi:LysR family transcriptional regulator [Telmatospirillum sp.]|uniref:LysR family transcriptional regulator n=1 Tax=Telmatospirillum sp. TaxID=2079197 RepID=UPI00284F10FB|nr:LysR family transcriptional regulator [Telmatospirillum sp.]MDR3438162.1 LysR family transcriptional regulator [Telmatospirillum sp.]
MNLRQIEIFRTVMLMGSISDAARHLNVSQPNVSRMLRHTEDRMGFRLFERIKGRLYATDEARALYAEVEKVYRDVQTVDAVARDLAESKSGRLRLACSPSLGVALVPEAIARFCQGRERLRISLEILPQTALIEQVLTHQSDLGISMFPADHPTLSEEKLRRGRLVCVMPKGHPLAGLRVVRPRDIVPYPFIAYDRGSSQGAMVDSLFSGAEVVPTTALEVRFGQTACTLVQAGAGVALVDEFSAMGGGFPNLVFRPFLPETWFTVSIIRDRLRPLSTPAQSFVEYLRAAAAQSGTDVPLIPE